MQIQQRQNVGLTPYNTFHLTIQYTILVNTQLMREAPSFVSDSLWQAPVQSFPKVHSCDFRRMYDEGGMKLASIPPHAYHPNLGSCPVIS